MCDIVYTSGACNQTPSCADWGSNDLICFGSCNSVLIYDRNVGSGGKIIDSLCLHQKRVNTVKWFKGIDFEFELVSGSADGVAIVWTRYEDEYKPFVLKGHESSVNFVENLYTDTVTKSALVITASADSTVRIWFRKEKDGEFSQTQKIDLTYGVALSLKLAYLPDQKAVILAAALDDSKIHLYIENEDKTNDSEISFVHSQKLEGHEDWVRGLDFKVNDGDLYLVSCAQDNFIRLWKISLESKQRAVDEASYADGLEQFDFIMKRKFIEVSGTKYVITLESVIAGHEGWVYSVKWNPEDMTFLSASIDKSMIIWQWSTDSNMWLEKVRVGEVGGNTLGFYGGVFGPRGKYFLAHGYHGAFHIWNYYKESDMCYPCVTVGGHFSEVSDIGWDPKGQYLMSVSYDQTTRIHAPWKKEDLALTWHEIARPQVHGYDMNCLAVLTRYCFASGADEKLIRTFKAPKNFVENFKKLCKVEDDEESDEILKDLKPQGAAVPSLGLSNKAIFEEDNIDDVKGNSEKDSYPIESHFRAVHLDTPPTEETLLQNTLWPEIQKLYGHGYEIYSLAASLDGKLLASACKATSLEHAAILLWDTSSWTQTQKLISHSLTVVQLEFSPDSRYLLSVSRDRRWSLFSRKPNSSEFELIATTDKKTGLHKRIIWCCAWTRDSRYFATGSRDGKIVIWRINTEKVAQDVLGQCEHVFVMDQNGESVTALAFAPILVNDFYMFAIGLESGTILIYLWKPNGEIKKYLNLDKRKAHHLSVRRLKFRPLLGQAGTQDLENEVVQLASCGSDNIVRVYNIFLPKDV